MTYKTILVHVDNGKRCLTRLEMGVRLARHFGAHLVGLHALSVPRLPAYAAAEAGHAFIEAHQRIARESAQSGEATFRRVTDREGVSNAEWRASFDDVTDAVPLHARYADLVVVGQTDPSDGSGVLPDFPHQLVLTVGRPVLLVPYAGRFETLGRRILLAWNAGREATRATTDAIPFLRDAEEVNVVAVNPAGRQHGEVPGADIGLYLARHGVRVKVSNVQATEIDVGNQLLSSAADLSSDLIVMGAYGHSRFAELVLGGVTRTMLESMTVPVLMTH